MSSYGQGGGRGWQRARANVLRRDEYRCKAGVLGICIGHATQVDHVQSLASLGIPRSHPAANDPSNLRAICAPCHEFKTERERVKALAESNRQRAAARRARLGRKDNGHPGDD